MRRGLEFGFRSEVSSSQDEELQILILLCGARIEATPLWNFLINDSSLVTLTRRVQNDADFTSNPPNEISGSRRCHLKNRLSDRAGASPPAQRRTTISEPGAAARAAPGAW